MDGKPKIILTPREQQLTNMLLDVTMFINSSRTETESPIILRYAGGWVRDKLLAKKSEDVDVAINKLTGAGFALQLKKYLEDPANLSKHSLKSEDIKNVHTIKANPEKSKHLETVTTKLFQLDLDFVNLRKETYTEDSRNPTVEFGDEQEDARRRDATINALFYNLHTEEVEDFTGGLVDLANKTIRTPMNPETTFIDDPLRILRLIRFASRYQFTIEPETTKWMNDKTVLKAFQTKITRERVGVEFKKMMKERDNNPQGPVMALRMIDDLGLYDTVFAIPGMNLEITPETSTWKLAYGCLAVLEDDIAGPKTWRALYDTLIPSEEDRYISWILASLTPWTTIPPPQAGDPYAVRALKDGLKADNSVSKLAFGAFKNYKNVAAFKDSVNKGSRAKDDTIERETVGLMIRKWEVGNGCSWRYQALLALLVESMTSNPEGYQHIFAEWNALISLITQLDLVEVGTIKPIVDGKILLQAMTGKKAGPWLKDALELCIGIQLKHEKDSSMSKENIVELAIEEVKRTYG